MFSKLTRTLGRISPLADPQLRHLWVVLRALVYVRVLRRLRTLDSDAALKANLSHNLRSLYSANPRMRLLLYPLALIETLNRDARILVIGPRNEFDLYTLAALGFDLDRIVGLDLISYSPRIQLGDMHAMPFADASFDAVVCGWTLSYSTEPARAAQEIGRVTKPGGVIAVGVEYSAWGAEDERKLLGYQLLERDKLAQRVNSTAAIRALFADVLGEVYFEHDAPRKVSHGGDSARADVSNVALVFGTRGPQQ